MKSMMIDGYKFEGPYIAGKGEIPEIEGIALICSEAGEGVKILAIENGENLRTHIESSPRMDTWKGAAYKGIVDVYVLPMDSSKRESVASSMVSKRASTLVCQEFKQIVDDW